MQTVSQDTHICGYNFWKKIPFFILSMENNKDSQELKRYAVIIVVTNYTHSKAFNFLTCATSSIYNVFLSFGYYFTGLKLLQVREKFGHK